MEKFQEEIDKYVKDVRVVCKYGRECYQTRPSHHQQYKHPPKDEPPADIDNNKATKKPRIGKAGETSNVQKADVKKKNDLRTYFKPIRKTPGTFSNRTEQEKTDISEHSNNSYFDKKLFIKEKFLVEMPTDFYSFYELCVRLQPLNPLLAFAGVDLILVGPFDVLADKFTKAREKSHEEYLIHWRYFYDPPEFQTVLKRESSEHGYHIGYFRDCPDKNPVFLASNCAEVDGILNVMGNNIYAAVYLYLEEYKKFGNPFKTSQVPKLQTLIKNEAEKHEFNLSAKSLSIIARNRNIVTKTFNKAGLVVPYNKKTRLGYRELSLSNKELHLLLQKLKVCTPDEQTKLLSELQPVITNASIALDEYDFGTGLELGLNLHFYGIACLTYTTLRFLRDSYNLLNRTAFAKIAEAHLLNRRKGCDLSIL